MRKKGKISNINITIIMQDHILTFPLQIHNGWAYSLCHNCIYGMQIIPNIRRKLTKTETVLAVIRELNKRKLKLNLEGHYCIKRRQVIYYPKCEDAVYA